MQIEETCFDEDTQEEREVYRDRLVSFSDGCFILEYDGHPVGFIASELWKIESPHEKIFELWPADLCCHRDAGRTLYISSIAILPEYRGRRWASLFLSSALRYLLHRYDQIERILLLVAEEWAPARRLYAAMGLREAMHVGDFFGGYTVPSHDAIVMMANVAEVTGLIELHSDVSMQVSNGHNAMV